jgi:hypothetical protein
MAQVQALRHLSTFENYLFTSLFHSCCWGSGGRSGPGGFAASGRFSGPSPLPGPAAGLLAARVRPGPRVLVVLRAAVCVLSVWGFVPSSADWVKPTLGTLAPAV